MDSERKWWPQSMLDESMPPSRQNPTDWIIARADDGWIVAGWEEHEGNENFGSGRETVRAGETMAFAWCEDRGTAEILIKEDGSYEIVLDQPDLLDPDRPPDPTEIPADATHFWEPGDIDTLMDSMADFARCYAENEGGSALPMRVTVAMARWEDDIPHRLIVEDGQARFEPIAKNDVQ